MALTSMLSLGASLSSSPRGNEAWRHAIVFPQYSISPQFHGLSQENDQITSIGTLTFTLNTCGIKDLQKRDFFLRLTGKVIPLVFRTVKGEESLANITFTNEIGRDEIALFNTPRVA